ncbi:MAG: sugar ABC transporter permease [Lachnospiraceae bacterium]|nr:sugar ABC transporter permease [Lachnospiraceae bacterium]
MSSEKKKMLFKDNLELYILLLPAVIVMLVYCYAPMFGYLIAFQDYTPGAGFWGPNTKWVGFYHFLRFYDSIFFGRLMSNTLWLSFLNLIWGFWVPIVFALLLNEVQHTGYKKCIQTASYLPYFISMVTACGMLISFIATNGLINRLIVALGGTAQPWRNIPGKFATIYVLMNIWKGFGFNSILYISVITSIDSSLYEAARLDGANRMQQVFHITIPSIIPTIAIMLIMAVGSLVNANTDMILLLYLPSTYETADVLGTYIYREGLTGGKFSFTTAIGMIQSIINFVLVFVANTISDVLTGAGLF